MIHWLALAAATVAASEPQAPPRDVETLTIEAAKTPRQREDIRAVELVRW